MKTEKLNLKSIKNVLSRGEMRKIMAGSGFGCSAQGSGCGDLPCCPGLSCDPMLNGGYGGGDCEPCINQGCI